MSLTKNYPWRKALAANASTSSFAAKVATLTEPSGDGVASLTTVPGGEVPCHVLLLPYGLGADDDAFSLRLVGWRRIGSGPYPGVLWVPTTLAELSCTISTSVGVAAAPVINTERFADTITIVANMEPTTTADTTRMGTFTIFSPANNTPAWAMIPTQGVEKLEFLFDQTTNTPTMNCLIAF